MNEPTVKRVKFPNTGSYAVSRTPLFGTTKNPKACSARGFTHCRGHYCMRVSSQGSIYISIVNVDRESAIVTKAIYNVNKQTVPTFYIMTQQHQYDDDEVIKRGKQSIVDKDMKPLLMVLKT
jgi:hypothetical protein